MATAMPGGIFDWPEPVRDVNGQELRFVRVPPGEQTCVVCGETAPASQSFCIRCSNVEAGRLAGKLVPTIEYLREDEYVVMA